LVRERSRVQSSLAAPSFPKEIQHFAKNARDVSGRFATERNAKTRAKLGEIWVARSCSGPPGPKTEIAARLGEPDGDKSIKKASNLQAEGYSDYKSNAIEKLPNRATLARKWPALRINRLTWRWRDDASGARGDDITSLIAFLGEGAR
jgi:hypothetical protein